ncbi:MAG: hypothetical protein NTU89_03070 [Candidatus Dependentiae bacterium]|nr:hypothetical protein [Candidatus Dependentiae bacterium]
MSMYSKLNRTISSNYSSFCAQFSSKYAKEAFIGFIVLVVLVGGYFFNARYVQAREERAFVALSEVIELFTQAQQETQSLDKTKDHDKIQLAWSDAQHLLDALHKENMSSILAPYFLVFKSQIMIEKDNNLDGAIGLLDEAIAQMPKNSEMRSLFQLKRIKMGFDSTNPDVVKNSLADLITMTQDLKNPSFQEALYLLGVYYVHAGDIEKSQQAFKKLVDNADKEAIIVSPWVKQAQDKLISASPEVADSAVADLQS